MIVVVGSAAPAFWAVNEVVIAASCAETASNSSGIAVRKDIFFS
jgi:hypothetical protein